MQFNEANFDLIKKYADTHNLEGFKKIFSFPSYYHTSSEKEYKNLEPWIQWYSFYSNLNISQHKVFHLGDCLKTDHKMFTENMYNQKIGIFGSMNLRPSKQYSIYIPDPWTETDSDKSLSSKLVSMTMRQLVNENAQLKLSLRSILGLIVLLGSQSIFNDFKVILHSMISFLKKERSVLASTFDYFFSSYSLKRIKRNKINLGMIFLNGFAHIQHHYLFNSKFIDGKNPEWYCNSDSDPLLNSLKIYNKFFQKLFKQFENSHEIWIITGLTQIPTTTPEIYWRFKNHKKLLRNFFDFDFKVFPRMTRDFEIEVMNKKNYKIIYNFLENAEVHDGKNKYKAFEFTDLSNDNRIFTSFAYKGDNKQTNLIWKNKSVKIKNQLVFVAIKNGIHSELGWAISNSHTSNKNQLETIPIWELSKYLNLKKIA